jgi:hypothetical protein
VTREPLITINIRNRPLVEALGVIEAKVPIRFAYASDILQGRGNVSITASAMPLQEFLAALFRQTGLSYRRIGDQVVLQSDILPEVTLSGFVRDARTGEMLIGASVYLPAQRSSDGGMAGVLASKYGFYSLTVKKRDSIAIEVSYVGYRSQRQMIACAQSDIRVSFDLQTDTTSADSTKFVFMKDRREDFLTKNRPGVIDLSTSMITGSPSANGGGDLIAGVEMMPGVQAGIDGTPGYFVRGGNAGQNLILLDDATLYNPSHIFGLVGIFNPSAIRQASLMKGGFPASYGDHVSSVLDVTMKNGSDQQAGGDLRLGSISSGATIYGPLEPGSSSFLIAGRRSTTDVLLHPFLNNNYFSNYYFYDVNAKLNFRLSPKDRLFLSFYTGRDNNSYAGDSADLSGIGYSMHFGNTAAAARWNHQYSGKLFENTTLEYNNYHQFLSATQEGYFAQLYSGIRDLDVKTNLTWYLSPAHQIHAGADYLFQMLYPASLSGKTARADSSATIVPSGLPSKTASRTALYADDEWKPGSRWQLYAGIRVPFYYRPDASYFSLEPRLAVTYLVAPTTSVKLSFTAMHQYIHLVQSYNATFPAEIWIGGSHKVQPQYCQELTAGVYQNFGGNAIQASLEIYYKRLDHQLLFGGAPSPMIDNNIENQLIFGRGQDYGAELFLRKNRGRLTGWLAYTLAYAYEQFDSLNEGQRFPFAYDRRHMINLSTSYALTPHWKIGANFLVASGRAFSLSPDSTFVPGNDPLDSSPGRGRSRAIGRNRNQNQDPGGTWDIIQNNYRLSPYNRLDLSVHYLKSQTFARRKTTTEWIFSVYNLYARQNNSFVYRTIDPTTRKVIARELPLIPVIPSITFSYSF